MVDLNISLPDSFLQGEERDGYYVSENMKKIWAVELDLFQLLINVCKKYDIKFWADGGTMLGAIRHGGYIPWDDDIDVIMTRENYTKLCSVAASEFKYPYFFQTDYTDPGSLRGHAQLRNSETTGILKMEYEAKFSFNQGIFIDIFPLDFIPDQGREEYFKKLGELLDKAYWYCCLTVRYDNIEHNGNFKRRLRDEIDHKMLLRNGYHNKYFEAFEEVVSKVDKVPTSTVGKVFKHPASERTFWKWEWFMDTIEVPFEMLTVPIPGGYRECLNKFYGSDWGNPKQADSSHGGVIFDVDKSYKEYIK